VAFQSATGPLFVSTIQRATRRKVIAYSCEVHLETRFEVAVFRLGPDESAPCA
jgi:hypothetical protein